MLTQAAPKQLLGNLRILEIGHFVAAPFCTRLLADFGADIIKVEPLSGDPVRQWGEQVNGHSLWWSLHGRNKRSIALDLKKHTARDIILELVPYCDAVVENFRPGHLEKLGLGPSTLRGVKPDLILAQISGFGQTGPYRDRSAFGVIGEAIGGLRYLTNHPPGTSSTPPVRCGISIGDSIAGLYAAFGVMAALWQRDRLGGDGMGRTLDVALTEAVLSLMEGMLPEFGRLGKIKQPTGGGIATAAPSNAYPTRDGDCVLIAANSDPLFARLCELMGKKTLASSIKFVGNPSRVANAVELDRIIASWTVLATADELISLLNGADIPNCKIYTAADCVEDMQYRHRGMIQDVYDPSLGMILQSGVVPRVAETPGSIRWAGATIGQHGEDILRELLGYDLPRINELRTAGVMR
jgi:crotonobetainyl-CoA:carnitine CoA-transferase CaiB-like acyl-CoA transferase